mgnify:CR=1 FL=1
MSKRTELNLNGRKEFGETEPEQPVPAPPQPPPNPAQIAQAAANKAAAEAKHVEPAELPVAEIIQIPAPINPGKGPLNAEALAPALEEFTTASAIAAVATTKNDDRTVAIVADKLAKVGGKIWTSCETMRGDILVKAIAALRSLALFSEPAKITAAQESLIGPAFTTFEKGLLTALAIREKAKLGADKIVKEAEAALETAKSKLNSQILKMEGDITAKVEIMTVEQQNWQTALDVLLIVISVGFEWLLGRPLLEKASDPVTAAVFTLLIAFILTSCMLYFGRCYAITSHADAVNKRLISEGKAERAVVSEKTRNVQRWSLRLYGLMVLVLIAVRFGAAQHSDTAVFDTVVITGGLIGISLFAGLVKYMRARKHEESELAVYSELKVKVENANTELETAKNTPNDADQKFDDSVATLKAQFEQATRLPVAVRPLEDAQRIAVTTAGHYLNLFNWVRESYLEAVRKAIELILEAQPERRNEFFQEIELGDDELRPEVLDAIKAAFDAHVKATLLTQDELEQMKNFDPAKALKDALAGVAFPKLDDIVTAKKNEADEQLAIAIDGKKQEETAPAVIEPAAPVIVVTAPKLVVPKINWN